MNSDSPTGSTPPPPEGWPVFDLWKKYEEIAMHFNDLLIRLRTQALAGVATVVTIIGVLFRRSGSLDSRWDIIALSFLLLVVFWVAVWVLDFCYYNRLLSGAVAALLDLENLSKERHYVHYINLSTKIEDGVAGLLRKNPRRCPTNCGIWFYYSAVLLALFSVLILSIVHIC